VFRNQTRQRVPDIELSNHPAQHDIRLRDERAENGEECSTPQYEKLTFGKLGNNPGERNSEYMVLNEEHEYSNTAHCKF